MSTFVQDLNNLSNEFKESKFSYLTSIKLRLEQLNSTKNEKLITLNDNESYESITLVNFTDQINDLKKSVQISSNETLNAINSIDCIHNVQLSSFESAILQLDKKVVTLDEKFVEFDEKVSNYMAQDSNKGDSCINSNERGTIFEETSVEFQTKALQKFGYIEAEIMDSRFKILKSVELKHQELEKRLIEKIENVEKLLTEKFEQIMKALKVEN